MWRSHDSQPTAEISLCLTFRLVLECPRICTKCDQNAARSDWFACPQCRFTQNRRVTRRMPSRFMLTAMGDPHPCVAILPCRASGRETQTIMLPKGNQYLRRPHPQPSSGPRTPPIRCCGANRRRYNHHLHLGKQRIPSGNPPPSDHYPIPGLRPKAPRRLIL